ncbi:MAG: pyridoxal phosphate-dependent aminotransferase [Myxococcota bacterium]
MTVFSRRGRAERAPAALAARQAELEATGASLVDLTGTNPTTCGLPVNAPAWPEVAEYVPAPLGLEVARVAVARHLGLQAVPSRVALTASTSEAYAWLLTALCDAGDDVLVPHPGYPLLEAFAAYAGVRLSPYALRDEGTHWALDVPALLEAATPRTRAVVVVSPANPTGHLLREDELAALSAVCAGRGWALVVDEVFHDAARHGLPVAGRQLPCLTFALGGLSKACGLPQAKLAWTVVSGPPPLVDEALYRLEALGDAFLSVGSAVQHAAPALLAGGTAFRSAVSARVQENHAALRARRRTDATWDVRPVHGGWAQVLRLPASRSEDATCLRALDAGVVVHPGWYYDFPSGAWLVLSLLAPPADFARGLERLVPVLDATW